MGLSTKDTTYEFAKFDGNQQITWDTSSLSSFQACPRKYQLGTINGLRLAPSDDKTQTTSWGHAYHTAQEVRTAALFAGASREEALDAAVQWLFENANDLRSQLDGGSDNSRTFETLLRALVWYEETYRDENLETARLPNGEAAIEVRFEAPLPFADKRLSGRIDRLVYADGSLYVLDYKTTKTTLGPYYFQGYSPDNQIYTYLYACRQLLGMDVAGFIVDACQTLVGSTRFARATFDVTPGQVDEWLEGVEMDIKQADSLAAAGVQYPQRFTACGMYGGCPFRRLCSRPEEHRQTWIDEEYVVYERRK